MDSATSRVETLLHRRCKEKKGRKKEGGGVSPATLAGGRGVLRANLVEDAPPMAPIAESASPLAYDLPM